MRAALIATLTVAAVTSAGARPQLSAESALALDRSVRKEVASALLAAGLTQSDFDSAFSIVARTLDGKDTLSLYPENVFHAASTMKVPVMIELFRRVDARQLRLDDTIIVSNRFHSIVDGSEYTLASTEDSDGEVYKSIGRPMTYRALVEAMITVSSNLAANVLIEKLGVEPIRATVGALRAPGMKLLRGVEDQKAFDKGLNNETTGAALATLLSAIANHTAASPASCDEMAAILKRQKFRAGIPAGVPPGIAVGHKTGTITKVHHDAGIVYAARPYVLVVMTRGFPTEAESDALIARISQLVYAAWASR